jgi:hypothetical protein
MSADEDDLARSLEAAAEDEAEAGRVNAIKAHFFRRVAEEIRQRGDPGARVRDVLTAGEIDALLEKSITAVIPSALPERVDQLKRQIITNGGG